MRKVLKNSIAAVKDLATLSSHNYKNKYELLKAELFSLEEKDKKAREAYDAAIEASRTSNIINETGLAFELAGRHCESVHDKRDALNFYLEAKQCYADWGSKMKMDAIDRCISRLAN